MMLVMSAAVKTLLGAVGLSNSDKGYETPTAYESCTNLLFLLHVANPNVNDIFMQCIVDCGTAG